SVLSKNLRVGSATRCIRGGQTFGNVVHAGHSGPHAVMPRVGRVKLDLIIKNANVLTLNDEHPQAHAVGVWNGRIVGLDDDISELPAARIVDAAGATVTPGFHDVHNHMAAFGQQLQEIDASGFTSADQLYDA